MFYRKIKNNLHGIQLFCVCGKERRGEEMVGVNCFQSKSPSNFSFDPNHWDRQCLKTKTCPNTGKPAC